MAYFKTEEDVRAAKVSAISEYQKQTERLALLKDEAAKLSRKFMTPGVSLVSRPAHIDIEPVVTDLERVNPLVDDIRKTTVEVERLKAVVETLGLLHE